MPAGKEPPEPRLHSLIAASAAANAVKRAHRAAALAVYTAAPPWPHSQYFARNRGGLPASRGEQVPPKSGRSPADGEVEERDDMGSEEGNGHGGGGEGSGAATGGGAVLASEDSASSVSRSITSSGLSSEYTTDDDDGGSSEDDEDSDGDDAEDAGQEEDFGTKTVAGNSGTKTVAGNPGTATGADRLRAASRLNCVSAAMVAVALARSRLRQGGSRPGTGHRSAAPSPTGVAAAAAAVTTAATATTDTPRLPPVVQRQRSGSHDAASSDSAAAAAMSGDGRRADAAAVAATATSGGDLSALRSSPLFATTSRRGALLQAPPGLGGGGGGSGGGVTTPVASPVPVSLIGGGDKSECLAEWVSQRFRTAPRTTMAVSGAAAGTGAAVATVAAPQTAKSASGAGGAGSSGIGEACIGLRGLLTARSDGAASWYARPARWHDPLSQASATHTSLPDARPPAQTHAAQQSANTSPSLPLATTREQYRRVEALG